MFQCQIRWSRIHTFSAINLGTFLPKLLDLCSLDSRLVCVMVMKICFLLFLVLLEFIKPSLLELILRLFLFFQIIGGILNNQYIQLISGLIFEVQFCDKIIICRNISLLLNCILDAFGKGKYNLT